MTAHKVLAYIPARAGSKRLPGKNIKDFMGKPLIAYAIEQALAMPFIDRVIVDTESEEIAAIAKQYGADVPFLRPNELAQDDSNVIDTIIYTLDRLKEDEGYVPTHLLILQTTSPLREPEDIERSWKKILETDATAVITVCQIHPKLYNVDDEDTLHLVNNSDNTSTNAQAWDDGFIPNGGVFITAVPELYSERTVMTKNTKAVVCPNWRSVDVDIPEEWAMAEVLYKHRDDIKKHILELD